MHVYIKTPNGSSSEPHHLHIKNEEDLEKLVDFLTSEWIYRRISDKQRW